METSIEVGDRTKRIYKKLFDKINNNYTIDYLCTDKLKAYTSYNYTSANKDKYIPKKQISKHLAKKIELNEDLKEFTIHIRSKSETCLIEATNTRIRHYLARFRRKSLCMSKSVEIIEWSLYLLFDKLYWGGL